MKNALLLFIISIFFVAPNIAFSQQTEEPTVKPIIHTFLGNESRNYYGNRAPERLDLIWKHYLGEGISPAYGNPERLWKGAGWTGQPLFIRENGKDYLIIGSFDYSMKKIDAETGTLVWEYKFDDIVKSTPTFYIDEDAKTLEHKYIIMQGSRRGFNTEIDAEFAPSFRAVSYLTGKEIWRMNVTQTDSYSRDVDASALIVGDTAYIGLENGLFTLFSPKAHKQEMLDGMLQAKIYKQLQYYTKSDMEVRGDGLEIESSPTLLNGVIYTPCGSGHIYGYSIEKGENVFDLNLKTDLNGTAPATNDQCLIIAVEKEDIPGPGGAMKIDPSKPAEESVVWFYPTENKKWIHWQGGLIGSVAVNDAYVSGDTTRIAAFIDVAGWLHIVDHQTLEPNLRSIGPDGISQYPVPKLLFKEKVVGTISSPLIVKDKLIAPTDEGLYLYQIDLENEKFSLLDFVPDLEIDAAPIAVDGKIYLGVRDGYLYCFGEKD